MAFNMVDLITAIKTRLEASDSSAFRGGLVYPLRAPPGLGPTVGALPLVTFNLSWDGDDTFQSDGMTAQVLVTIADHIQNTTAPTFAAYQRVYGDADPPDTAPTYGLHRHKLVLVGSDNAPSIMVCTGGDTLYDEDPNVTGLVLRFTVNIDKVIPEA